MPDQANAKEFTAQLDHAAKILRSAQRVAVLTGAGISAESGIATFRGAGGLWEGHRLEEVASPEGFHQNPALVWRFYNLRRQNLAQAQPNPGHHALATLESHLGRDNFTLITQNVDGLHQAAGNQHVLELHGTLRQVRCTGCNASTDRGAEALAELPKCEQCNALLRPAVVWFGEMLPAATWMAAEQAARSCACFLVVGTSAVVFPAAGLILLAQEHGAAVIEINMERTAASSIADVGLYGPAGQILPQLIARAF